MEGAGDRLRGLLRLVDLDHQLGDVGEEPRIVLLLQCQPAKIPALDLADQHHHGCRVVIGRVQCHHCVRQPRSARHQGDPGTVAQPAVGHRHKARTPLVPAHHDADRVLVDQRAGQPDIALARHAVDLVDIMRFKTFRQQAGDGLGHVKFVPGSICNQTLGIQEVPEPRKTPSQSRNSAAQISILIQTCGFIPKCRLSFLTRISSKISSYGRIALIGAPDSACGRGFPRDHPSAAASLPDASLARSSHAKVAI